MKEQKAQPQLVIGCNDAEAIVRLMAYSIAKGDMEKAKSLVKWAYSGNGQKVNENDFIERFVYPGWDDTASGRNEFVRDYIRGNKKYDLGTVSETINNMDYNDFLKTPYWKAVVWEKKKMTSYTCEVCGETKLKGLAVQHLSFEHHGDEVHHLNELRCICKGCQKVVHGKKKENDDGYTEDLSKIKW